MKTYNKSNIPFAKALRKDMTRWEKKLWYDYLRFYPIRFQRQKAIGNYIVDFYCAKAKLIIELDGSIHYEEGCQEKDALRSKELEKMGFKIVRFLDPEIDKNFKGVCEFIDTTVKKSLL